MQLSGGYATKYNRITAYTKINISSDYSVQVGYIDAAINLWGIDSKIKVITNWQVSIEPLCLNKLAKIVQSPTKLTAKYGEYVSLMDFLTKTGINLLDLIDLQEVEFSSLIDSIYQKTNTSLFREVLLTLRNKYSKASKLSGRNVIRYLLLNLKEETIDDVLPNQYYTKCLRGQPYISTRCFPFEMNPFLSNLAGRKTSEAGQIGHIIDIARGDNIEIVRPYLSLKNAIKQTGEIYFEANSIANDEAICKYNSSLDSWESRQGYQINQENGLICIDSYEKTTIDILQRLWDISCNGNKGQRELNRNFIKQSNIDLKKKPMRVCSSGSGKTSDIFLTTSPFNLGCAVPVLRLI